MLAPGCLPPRLAEPVTRATADRRVGLDELRGTPVVLNFWASWCIPCRVEAPLLQRSWTEHGTEGVLFLGLNMQDARQDARDFVAEFDQTFPNVRDPDNATARAWGVSGLPETFFIRLDGRVVGHVIGVVSRQQLENGIQSAVARARRGFGRRSASDALNPSALGRHPEPRAQRESKLTVREAFRGSPQRATGAGHDARRHAAPSSRGGHRVRAPICTGSCCTSSAEAPMVGVILRS